MNRVRFACAVASAKRYSPDHEPLAHICRNYVQIRIDVRAASHAQMSFEDESWSSDEEADIHAAAAEHNVAEIRRLVEEGVDVNSPNHRGQTVLHIALMMSTSYDRMLDCVKSLIQLKANVNAADNRARAPLHYVCRQIVIAGD